MVANGNGTIVARWPTVPGADSADLEPPEAREIVTACDDSGR
jgi:hypothetical protein